MLPKMLAKIIRVCCRGGATTFDNSEGDRERTCRDRGSEGGAGDISVLRLLERRYTTFYVAQHSQDSVKHI